MKIKELRERTKTNASDIAKLLDISIQSYYRYETGQNEPSLQNLIKIADFYGVTLDYLCDHKTAYHTELGLLNESQQNIIEALPKLNESNTNKVIGYINGLLENQNKEN